MTDIDLHDNGEISLFSVGTTLIRNRWRVGLWSIIGGVLAVLSLWSNRPVYKASASFVPQGNDAGRSGLASLAGQFGVSLPTNSSQSLSPEFYSQLLVSRVLLLPIVRDSFVVPEVSNKAIGFTDLFGIRDASPDGRQDKAIAALRSAVGVSIGKSTGVVAVTVTTQWRSASLALATALVNGINEYNQRTRQGQAAEERRFVEGRLELAKADLRQAEDRLEGFLTTNRQFNSSSELTFEHDRIQRDVTLKQQVYTSLTQAYEDARIHEVRDTPVITVFEAPSVPAVPEPRGRLNRLIEGVFLGGILGAIVALFSSMVSGGHAPHDAAAQEFVTALDEARTQLLRPARKLVGRGRSASRDGS
ncbi:MAG: lipopolysaccharide biosynthesis protein [Gemmatimonadetes bacterium]|nr:lipopolysaccharide biosynthesis protein [Gemmatimonadota bacterium]